MSQDVEVRILSSAPNIMIVFCTVIFSVLAYALGVTLERDRWRYGQHFFENGIAWRLVRTKQGGFRREPL